MKQHCEDKLMLLYTKYIKTEAGKQIGAPLHQEVVDFYQGSVTLEQLLLKHSANGGA